MLNGVYTPEFIGQYRKASAVLPLENSRRWWRNRRFGQGRRELPSPCYVASHQQDGRRDVFRPKFADEVSHFRNAIPLYWLYDYTILYDSIRRKSTASYSYEEMFTSLLRDDGMKNRRDRVSFIPSAQGGGVTQDFFKSETICAFHWNVTHEAMNPGGGEPVFLKVRNGMGFSISP